MTPANRSSAPSPPPPAEPRGGQGVTSHAALIPGWTEMAVWQPDGAAATARRARVWPQWLARLLRR